MLLPSRFLKPWLRLWWRTCGVWSPCPLQVYQMNFGHNQFGYFKHEGGNGEGLSRYWSALWIINCTSKLETIHLWSQRVTSVKVTSALPSPHFLPLTRPQRQGKHIFTLTLIDTVDPSETSAWFQYSAKCVRSTTASGMPPSGTPQVIHNQTSSLAQLLV